MTPATLKSIRMDMGLNMVAFANLLAHNTTHQHISRNKYRAWEKPKDGKDSWPFIPRHIAEATENLYRDFWSFVAQLVELGQDGKPLVLIHRNDMFDDAALPLPKGITVDNYNQAVGKAWGQLKDKDLEPEILFFSTDTSAESLYEEPKSPEAKRDAAAVGRHPKPTGPKPSGPDSTPHQLQVLRNGKAFNVGPLPFEPEELGHASLTSTKGANTPCEDSSSPTLRKLGSTSGSSEEDPGQRPHWTIWWGGKPN